jgi:para-nitrobenzyl esterase
MNFLRPCIALLLLTLIACSDGNNDSSIIVIDEARPQLDLVSTEPPIELPGISASYHAEVCYGAGLCVGERERNVLDIYLPESDQPTPLVIYFHGGAYVQGDKSSISAYDIREFLQAGIAVATINYSFIDINEPYDDIGVIKPLEDSARALQFLRYHYQSLNLDPEQVASYGISAGASTSLWLGTHDDLADPDNADPVLRESSRLKAVAALFTQGTLNFLRWKEILAPVVEPLAPILGGTDILTVATTLGAGPLLFAATGTDSVEELIAPEKQPYLENIDALGLMDASDAPIYAYNDSNIFAGNLVNLFLHHALHVIALSDRAQEVGLENVMYAVDSDPRFSLTDPSGEDHVTFLKRHIQ